jgi:hypothetical protein
VNQRPQYAPSFETPQGSGVDQAGNLTAGAIGAGLRVRAGVNCRTGRAVLIGGAALVPNTSITAATQAILTHEGDGGNVGILSHNPAANVAGVSFAIASSNGADVGHVRWMLFEPV